MDELPPLDAFGTLVFQVAGQQLSVASTRAIVSHLQERFGGHMPSPAELLAADPQVLRDSGFSARKGETLRALAERFVDGRLSDEALSRMTDDEVEATLTEVSGIGLWTARGFLLVALDRPDVFLSGDLALRRAIQRAYGFDHLPTEDEVARGVGSLAAVSEPCRRATCSHPNTTEELMNPVTGPRRHHRRRPARTGDGADRTARRPLGRDRQQPRPGIADVGGLGARRRRLGRDGGRGCSGRHRRHRRALGPRARGRAGPRLERSGRHRRDQRLGRRRSRTGGRRARSSPTSSPARAS